jgi:hypothetical protein
MSSRGSGRSNPRFTPNNLWLLGRMSGQEGASDRRAPEGESASGACAQPRPGARAPAEHPSAVARDRSALRTAGDKAAEGAPAKRVGGREAAGEPWRLRARSHAARVAEAKRFPRASRRAPLAATCMTRPRHRGAWSINPPGTHWFCRGAELPGLPPWLSSRGGPSCNRRYTGSSAPRQSSAQTERATRGASHRRTSQGR